uniref:Uncharacterized protein n=1 Tax=Tanacetum cinerariifolium TaxID=118510 RepID=A0A699RWS7_TANCI|nr:hypothetical protein [Tanacetum cinerariifolium]
MDCPLKEEGKTLEEAYYTQFGVPFPQVERSLPSLIETNPRDHVKSITTTEEAKTLKEDDKMPLIELSRAIIPFLGV